MSHHHETPTSADTPGLAAELTWGVTWPSLETFRVLARDRRVIPVVRRLLADGETPVGVYRKLAGDRPGTFLLESAEQGAWARYSIVGAQSLATLTEQDGATIPQHREMRVLMPRIGLRQRFRARWQRIARRHLEGDGLDPRPGRHGDL